MTTKQQNNTTQGTKKMHSFITIKQTGQYKHHGELGSRFLRAGQQLTIQWMINDRQDYVCLATQDGDNKCIQANVIVEGDCAETN